MSKYFPPYNNSSGSIKVELDLANMLQMIMLKI